MKRSDLVPLARVLKERSFPKDSIRSFKVELFNAGSTLLSKVPHVFVENQGEFVSLPFKKPCDPLGGKWGQATFVVIHVDESFPLKPGAELSLPRSDFPQLGAKEFYIGDVLGFRVVDENAKCWGVVSGHEVFGLNNVVLLVDSAWSFPTRWIEELRMESRELLVPGIASWAELDASSPADDADD